MVWFNDLSSNLFWAGGRFWVWYKHYARTNHNREQDTVQVGIGSIILWALFICYELEPPIWSLSSDRHGALLCDDLHLFMGYSCINNNGLFQKNNLV